MLPEDRQDLWVVTDISGSSLNVPGRKFEWHKNNAIFYAPLEGPNQNMAVRFANPPVEAEMTGPRSRESRRLCSSTSSTGRADAGQGRCRGRPDDLHVVVA